jgi:hypothetical protein
MLEQVDRRTAAVHVGARAFLVNAGDASGVAGEGAAGGGSSSAGSAEAESPV